MRRRSVFLCVTIAGAGVSVAEVAAWASVAGAGVRRAGGRSCPPVGAEEDSGAGLEAAEEDGSSLTLSTGLVLPLLPQ